MPDDVCDPMLSTYTSVGCFQRTGTLKHIRVYIKHPLCAIKIHDLLTLGLLA